MILAAGLGTRLRPLTDSLAKPAVPVANRPLAAFAMETLRGAGVRALRANVFAHADTMTAAFASLDPTLRVFREEELLGTGGGLHNALRDVDEEVIVMNGDVLFDADLGVALAAHRGADAFATMVVRPDPNALSMGAVHLDSAGYVRKIGPRPDVDLAGTSAFAFTGVHVLSKRALRALPRTGCIIKQGYHRFLEAGERIVGVVDLHRWADLGTHAAYLRTNVALASGEWPRVRAGRGGIVHETVRTRATLEASVVGEGAFVADHVRVERSVVWPGARVVSDVRDAIVTPQGVIVP